MAKILIVDDSKLSRAMTAAALSRAGHVVVEATDGVQALAACERHCPDCIVLDLLMPEMDGCEFLRQLRGAGSDVPVIVATADVQKTTRSWCERLEISGFLNKPLKADTLLPCVEAALAHDLESAK